MKKLYLGLLGVGAVGAVMLASKKASAGEAVPAGKTALVLAEPGLHVREAPTTEARVVGGTEGVSPDDAFTGTTVQVLRTGIKSSQPAISREWWEIISPGGARGFASAVGPKGEANLRLNP